MRKELAYFLIRLIPGQMILAVVSSILAGASTVALFAFVFLAARGSIPGEIRAPLIFVTLAVVFIACRSLAGLSMAHVGRAVVARLRTTLISEILRTPYCRLEAIGTHRLSAAVTMDIQTIAGAVPALVSAATNFAVVASLLVYMTWLSPPGAALIVAAAALGVPIYWSLIGRASRYSYQAGTVWERLSSNLNGLVSGVKQLKLNTGRTSRYLSDDIVGVQDAFLKLRGQATLTTIVATNTAQVIFLTVLGALLFLRPYDGPGASIEFFFAAIYLMGPLDAGVGAIAAFVHVNAVFRRNQELGIQLSSSSLLERPTRDATRNAAGWREIRFDEVTYSYDEATGFAFGPVSLQLQRGEIVFVKGGNGSGKSTFAKLLTGLYDPATGSILVDECPVGEVNRQPYRESFSCIFDDSHIFESLWTRERCDDGGDGARALLRDWSLERLVDVRDDRFTNTRALSRGQKRKLLLISASTEDREVCVFDEWAADQDSLSRKKFYFEFLPRLKRKGKLVVVLTHDEEFDSIADQIIKFHDGVIVASPGTATRSQERSFATRDK